MQLTKLLFKILSLQFIFLLGIFLFATHANVVEAALDCQLINRPFCDEIESPPPPANGHLINWTPCKIEVGTNLCQPSDTYTDWECDDGYVQSGNSCVPDCDPQAGNQCESDPNVCGDVNYGTYRCDGSCTASRPPNPSYYGQSCTSDPNICDQVNTGTYQCDMVCSASPPPDYQCDPTCTPVINGGWSAWSACSGGIQTRTCTNPAPSCGGTNCVGWNNQACSVADTTPPTGTINTLPAVTKTAPTTISGTASDNVAVASVQVIIRKGLTGGCTKSDRDWNGSSWVTACTVSLTPTGTTTWSQVMPSAANMTSGETYWIFLNVTDTAGNQNNGAASASFVYDTTAPTGTINSISNYISTPLTSVAGTASDNIAVAQVQLVLRRGPTGDCDSDNQDWNGTAWVSACTTVLTATGTTNWSYASLPPANSMTSGQRYRLYVNVVDTAGNQSNSYPNTSFVYDTTAPTGTITTIGSAVKNALGSLAGTASDNVGVALVQLVFRRGPTGNCDASNQDWNGTDWVTACTTALTASGTSNWGYGSMPIKSQMTAGQTYWVYVNVVDVAGNQSNSYPNISFIYDPFPPTATASPVEQTVQYPSTATTTLSFSDTGGSGLSEKKYLVDGIASSSSGISAPTAIVNVTVSGIGSHYVSWWAQDVAGNEASGVFQPYEVSPDQPGVSVSGAPATWAQSATATVVCSPDSNPCDTSSYRLYIIPYTGSELDCTSLGYAAYTETSPQSITSHVLVCGVAKNTVGGIGYSTAVEFKVDDVPPTTVGGGSTVTGLFPASGEYHDSVDLTLDPSKFQDSESGMQSLYLVYGTSYETALGSIDSAQLDALSVCDKSPATNCKKLIMNYPGTTTTLSIADTNSYAVVATDNASNTLTVTRRYKINYLSPIVRNAQITNSNTNSGLYDLTVQGNNFGGSGEVRFYQTENETSEVTAAARSYTSTGSSITLSSLPLNSNTTKFLRVKKNGIAPGGNDNWSPFYRLQWSNTQSVEVLQLSPSVLTVYPGDQIAFIATVGETTGSRTYTWTTDPNLTSSQPPLGSGNSTYLLTVNAAATPGQVYDVSVSTLSGEGTLLTAVSQVYIAEKSSTKGSKYTYVQDLPGVAVLDTFAGNDVDLYHGEESIGGVQFIATVLPEYNSNIMLHLVQTDGTESDLIFKYDTSTSSFIKEGSICEDNTLDNSCLFNQPVKKITLNAPDQSEQILRLQIGLFPVVNATEFTADTVPLEVPADLAGAAEQTPLTYVTTGNCYQMGTVLIGTDNIPRAVVRGNCPVVAPTEEVGSGDPGPIGIYDGETNVILLQTFLQYAP